MNNHFETEGPTETFENVQIVIDYFKRIQLRNLLPYKIMDAENVEIRRGKNEREKFNPKKKWVDYIIYYNDIKILLIEAKSKTDFNRACEQFEDSIETINSFYIDQKNGKKHIHILALLFVDKIIFYDYVEVDRHKIIRIKKDGKKIGKPLKIMDKYVFGFKV